MLYKLPGNYRLTKSSTKQEAGGSGDTSPATGVSWVSRSPFLFDFRTSFVKTPHSSKDISTDRLRDESFDAHNWTPGDYRVVFIEKRGCLRF